VTKRVGDVLGGLFWVAVWLFPLVGAASTVGRSARPAALAGAGLVLFCLLYTAVTWSAFDGAGRRWLRVAGYAATSALGFTLAAAYGGHWLYALLYVGAMSAAVFTDTPRPWLAVILVVLTVTAIVALGIAHHDDAGSYIGTAVGAGLSSALVFAVRQMSRLIDELRTTREQLAVAAVAEERLRFSRDLHDLLGHTLSLIVVKAELVRRLAERDPPAAAAQAADIEQVGRRALVEIREAVTGYREAGLTSELARARSALATAGVEVFVQRTAEALPEPTDALLAWVVREAVTNVVRHSGARECEIAVGTAEGTATVTVSDDGRGASGDSAGNGLRGLAERLDAAGGVLTTGPREDGRGFRLHASLPMASAS